MNIAMVTHWAFPPDTRIEIEASALIRAGYKVFVYANAKQSRQRVESFHGIVVRYFSPIVVLGSYIGSVPSIRSLLLHDDIDAVHVQDTPILLLSLLYGKLLSLPVIYDAHEIWPFLALENPRTSPLRRLWLFSYYSILESVGSQFCDLLVSVSEEQVEYFVGRYRVDKRKTVTAMNLVDLSMLPKLSRVELRSEEARTFKVCYVGGIEAARNLETVVEAAALLKDQNVSFVIVGEGNVRKDLQRLAQTLQASNVVFTGFLPFVQAMSVAASSDVCLVPHLKTFRTDRTFPHKVTQYMALGKAVIVSPLNPILRLLSSSVAVWNPMSAQRLAQIILEMRDNGTLRSELQAKGPQLVKEKLNWDHESVKLVDAYRRLLGHQMTDTYVRSERHTKKS